MMSARNFLMIGGALLLSACASSTLVNEAGDIAHQFCLSNEQPHSEARKLLLSPSLTRAMKTAQMRHGIITDNGPAFIAQPEADAPLPAPAPVNTDADMMPPHFDSAYNKQSDGTEADVVVVEETAPTYTNVAICKPGRVFTMNGVRYAEIHHSPATGGSGWTDRLVLKKIEGKWMIDDILFAPDYRRTMRQTLIRAE